jgi:hypothetical protein
MVVYFFRSAFFKPHFQVLKKSLYLFIYLKLPYKQTSALDKPFETKKKY